MRRSFVLVLAAATSIVIGSAVVFATIAHHTSGAGGPHNTTSHNSYNPAHSDVDGGVGSPYVAKMYLDYGGYAPGYTVLTDNNSPISIELVAGAVLNLKNPAQAACYYQTFTVNVDYFDSAGGHHEDSIGTVWYLHLAQASFAIPAGSVAPNASRANPYGTGTIYYFANKTVGTDYAGTGSCSDGQHTHIEWVSDHSWGAQFEWHGLGPDYFYAGHVHYPGDVFGGVTYRRDPVNQGVTLGYIGGDSTTPWFRDNPFSGAQS